MCIYSKGFMQLIKTEKCVFCTFITVYVVLLDGWNETEFVADTDEEAINKFLEYLATRR